jgi:hypothetical protein
MARHAGGYIDQTKSDILQLPQTLDLDAKKIFIISSDPTNRNDLALYKE